MRKKVTYIIIVLILGIGIFSLFLFQKKEENKGFALDITSSIVQDLYEMAVPNDNFYILKQLYGNTELTNEYKLNLGIMNLVKKIDNKNDSLEASQVEDSVKEILGADVIVNHQNIMFMINDHCGYNYNESKNRYDPFQGCGGIPPEYFYRRLIKAEESENKIILIEQSFYVYVDSNMGVNNIYIYNNYQQDKLLDYIKNDDGTFYEVKEEDYIEQGSIYEYTFRKENGKWIFESFEKINFI